MCHCPFISYFTNIINTLLTLTPQMAASASFWTAKQDVARWLSLAKKHPSFIGHRHRHLSPSKTNTLQISHPPYKPARGFRGEGEARLWWELLLFSRARADCKGAGWALEQFPAESRFPSEQRGEEVGLLFQAEPPRWTWEACGRGPGAGSLL